MNHPRSQPRHRYLEPPTPPADRTGPWSKLTHDGRAGWVAGSVHSRACFPGHTLNAERGAMSLWLLSIDDLGVWHTPEKVPDWDPAAYYVPLIADDLDEPDDVVLPDGVRGPGPIGRWDERRFALVYSMSWYRSLFAKFFHGPVYGDGTSRKPGAYHPQQKAITQIDHWSVPAMTWHHLVLTWDRPASEAFIYLNGVRVGSSPTYHPMRFDACGPTLVAGHPNWAMADLRFFEGAADDAWIESHDADSATPETDAARDRLARTYLGHDLEAADLSPAPGDGFVDQLTLSLRKPEHLDRFYQQGMPGCVRATPDGIEVRTPDTQFRSREGIETGQGYLWTEDFFRGELYLEYEFMPLKEQGLLLLCFQAAGIQGNDFMADEPRRIDGTMRTVFGDHVRNYHLEYFREMDDAEHRRASVGLFKQPWLMPMGYRCLPDRLAQNQWHKLQIRQDGTRLRIALGGKLVIDAQDSAHATCGPILRQGHVGLRCMWKTHVRYRDLKVATRPIDLRPL
ncbi:MAG: DUF1961 family protein [Planctomycetota bacterium]